MNTEPNELLICPISREYLEDPITTPCGHTFSRKSLIEWFNRQPMSCPICRKGIEFDPETAQKNITIAHLVEEEQHKINISGLVLAQVEQPVNPEQNLFTAKLLILNRETGQIPVTKTIAKLDISCSSKQNLGGKTLLLMVVDRSGSMSGNPLEQCKYSLRKIMQSTQNNNAIIPYILAYDDSCTQITNPDMLHVGGGTSFKCAFEKIVMTCEQHKNLVENIIVVFLTDGQDGNAATQKVLMDDFQTKLFAIWTKPIVIHTIGFGSGHDFQYLDNIRKLGTSEGAYRFADPNENRDILSSKINSITDSIVNSSIVPIEIKMSDVQIKSNMTNQKITCWLYHKPTQILISLANKEYDVPVEIVETCDQNLWIQYYSYLTDNLINETITFNNNKQKYSKESSEVYGELLLHRGKAILKFVSQPVSYDLEEDPQKVISRLMPILENIKQIMSGQVVDKLKLTDLKYEGQFATRKVDQNTNQSPVASRPAFIPLQQPTNLYNTKPILYKYRMTKKYQGGDIHLIVARRPRNEVNNISRCFYNDTDKIGNNIISLAACLGKCFSDSPFLSGDINHQNNYGETPLDLALLYGHWKSAQVLIDHNATTNLDKKMILLTCLNKKYFNTAKLMVNNNITKVEKEMSWCFNDPDIISWIMSNVEDNDPKTKQLLTIQKGFAENIDCLKDLKHYSFGTFPEILQKPTMGHLAVIQYLLDNKKSDACEEFPHVNTGDTLFPLFVACENGNYNLVKMLLKCAPNMINKQTKMGTTCLWIACANKHIDIVALLLSQGADPNICNLKGDSCLIPATQKGYTMIAKLLIEHNIDITLANKNLDNAVLIACRTGQEQVLVMLLEKYVKMNKLNEVLNHYALVDGFCPMLAAAEVSTTNCIAILHQYGADIECRTKENNIIIQSATPLHVACFYGKQRAVELLYKLGANINAVTLHGKTPLHLAIEGKHIEVTRFLLKNGANTNALDNQGKTPQFYAGPKSDMYKEFFSDELKDHLIQAIYSDKSQTDLREILLQHSQSIGCYDYDDILNMTDSRGMSLLTLSILKKDIAMEQILSSMHGNYIKRDECGLSPSFWKALLSGEVSEDSTVLYVKNVVNAEIQNKVLLDMSYQKKSGVDMLDTQNSNFESRMMIGYGSNSSTKNIVAKLELGKNMKHSLLGFMDKIGKVVSCNQAVLNELLFDAKVHVISRIALQQTAIGANVNALVAQEQNQNIKPHHMLVLYLFTMDDNICQQVNAKLEKLDTADILTPYIYCLYQSLCLLPVYPKECYRKINGFTYQPIGSVIEFSGFSIATSKWGQLSLDDHSTTFIIKHKTGRDISMYSRFQQNGEVIFLPGRKFTVSEHYVNNLVVFGQENIRKTSYVASQVNIDKYLNGKAGLIIELLEIDQ